MGMEADLLTRLGAVTGLAPLSGRIAWIERPRKSSPEFPALVMTIVSPGRQWTLSGPDNLDRPRIQFDFYGTSLDQLRDLFAAFRDEMETTPFVDVGATRFHPAMLDTQRDMPAEDLANGIRIFRFNADFQFYHETV